MRPERIVGGTCESPFPVYEGLADALATAHLTRPFDRDATVAHVLGTCAGYAYGDTDTVATIMVRLGLPGLACVRIAARVEAMFIFSTAYLVQSRCGRVVIVCYRGTETTNLAHWMADAEIGSESSTLALADGATRVRVHAGFYRNVRATFADVVRELTAAAEGRSLANRATTLDHPLQALYITGHSLGGAMALLFALMVSDHPLYRAIASRLRAVYTFGQPLALAAPPSVLPALEAKVFRHVALRDPVPGLPPAKWGRFNHVGKEYRFARGEWQRGEPPVEQFAGAGAIPRSVLNWLAPERRRASSRWTLEEHGPHYYIGALRPRDRVTEFGDY